MSKRIICLLAAIAGFCLILGGLIYCISYACFDRDFYKEEYAKINTARDIGISEEGLSQATDVLISYITDERDDLEVEAQINSTTKQVFNMREKLHMIDVKRLYLNSMTVANVCVILACIVFVVLFIIFRAKAAIPVLKGYIIANVVFLACLGAIGVFAAIDFNTFWTNFHYVFFDNDLWILNPATDVLIQMVPSQFFFDLVLRIAVMFGTVMLAALAAAVFGRELLKKREKANA